MRLVALSDTHERHGELTLPEADVLIHAGDFTWTGTPQQITKFAKWFGEQPAKWKILVPGNHDRTFETVPDAAERLIRLHCPRVVILDRRAIEIGGLVFYGEPRTPAYRDWAFMYERADAKRVWDSAPAKVDVLVTHGPPFGMRDMCLDGTRVGCVEQRRWIETRRPRLVVCGHIHEARGLGQIGTTMVANVACYDAVRGALGPLQGPTVIDLE